MWQAPTFATAAPLRACSAVSCPSDDSGRCVDLEDVVYGILCNTRFSGTVITTSGKLAVKEKRAYTGSFEGCTEFCDAYNKTECTGVAYADGECMAYDTITGTFSDPGLAAIRQ